MLLHPKLQHLQVYYFYRVFPTTSCGIRSSVVDKFFLCPSPSIACSSRLDNFPIQLISQGRTISDAVSVALTCTKCLRNHMRVIIRCQKSMQFPTITRIYGLHLQVVAEWNNHPACSFLRLIPEQGRSSPEWFEPPLQDSSSPA